MGGSQVPQHTYLKNDPIVALIILNTYVGFLKKLGVQSQQPDGFGGGGRSGKKFYCLRQCTSKRG